MWHASTSPFALLLLLIVVGALAAYALHYALVGPGARRRKESPEEILRRRLACGEITETEYRSLLAAIHPDGNRSSRTN